MADHRGEDAGLEPTETTPGAEKAGGEAEPLPRLEGYEVSGRLGQGGMGTVWRAVQLSTRRQVALKLLTTGSFATQRQRHRFEREVELASNLEHPNIARIYESGLHRGVYYYAMALIDGVRLDAYVEERGPSQQEVLELMATVCRAVQHAHQRGVIHRDLKPSNILVTEDGQPHVLDFGLAKTLVQGEQDVGVSVDGEVSGTPAYMSPEQASGRLAEIDTRSDVYSLGVILYRLLVGRPPHDLSGTKYEVLRRVAEEEVDRPRSVAKAIDRDLEALLLKALAHNPERRYATAGDLAEDIERYLNGDPLVARKPTATYFLLKRLRKHRLPVGVAAGVVLALGGLAAFSYVRIVIERNRTEGQRVKAVAAERVARQAEKTATEKAEAARRALYFNRIVLADAELRNPASAGVGVRALLLACPRDLRHWEWHRLWHLHDQSLMTLRGHKARVTAVAFSPNGTKIASGSYDKTIKIWDAGTGAELATLDGPLTFVNCIAFTPDGKHIASNGGGKAAAVWDVSTGQLLVSFGEPHEGRSLCSLAFSRPHGKWLVSGGTDKRVKIWNARTGALVRTLSGHGAPVVGVAFTPDGKRIISGSKQDETVKVWDVESGDEVMSVALPMGWLESVAVSPDGKQIAAATGSRHVMVLNADTGKEILTLRGHQGEVNSVVFKRWGSSIVTGSADKMVKIWDAATGEERRNLRGHQGAVLSVAYRPDGARIVSGSADGTVKVWTPTAPSDVVRMNGSPNGLVFSPDGRRLASGYQQTTMVQDVETGGVVMVVPCSLSPVQSVAWSPDGAHIATASGDATIKLWNAVTGTQVRSFRGHEGTVRAVAFQPDGRRLASGGEDKTVRLWEVASGKEVMTLGRHESPVRSVCFSPSGKWLVSKDADDLVKVWTPVLGTERMQLGTRRPPGPDQSPWRCQALFSRDGTRILSGNHDGTISVWDAETGAEVMTLRGHQGWVYSACFSPDGKRILSGSEDRTAKLWDTETGAQVQTFGLFRAGVLAVAFSPDGKRILVAPDGDAVHCYGSGSRDDESPADEPSPEGPDVP